MCQDFATFFNNKITQIRTDIAHTDQYVVDELGSYPYHKMEMFRTVNKENLLQIISVKFLFLLSRLQPTVFYKKIFAQFDCP